MTQWRVKENDPTVAQDEEDLKAFVRHENEEIAREMKYSICKSHCDGSREVVARQRSVARRGVGPAVHGRGL